jgi:hypothetical protein
MNRYTKYRQNSADCFAVAQQLSDPASKANMLEMAQSWLALAQHVEHSGELEMDDAISPGADNLIH